MRLLIGYVNDNIAGGIDKYIVKFVNTVTRMHPDIQIDFLTKLEENDFHRELQKKGHKVFYIPRSNHFITAVKETRRIIRENKYDMIYVNISNAYDCSGTIAAKLEKVKRIAVHSHTSSVTGTNPISVGLKKLFHIIMKPILEKTANTYFACSKLAAKWMYSKKLCKSKKYTVINNSIDSHRFAFNEKNREKIRKKYNVQDKYVLGFIGRFSPEKNNRFLIDILKEVMKTKDAVLICVGEGPDQNAFIDYAKKNNVYDRVIMAGTTKVPEEFYSAYDVFLLPSIYEGLPIVGVEAQFNNLPAIFSKNISDEVLIGKNSFHVSIDDARKWADTINKIPKRENKLLPSAEGYKLENDNFDNVLGLKNKEKKK